MATGAVGCVARLELAFDMTDKRIVVAIVADDSAVLRSAQFNHLQESAESLRV